MKPITILHDLHHSQSLLEQEVPESPECIGAGGVLASVAGQPGDGQLGLVLTSHHLAIKHPLVLHYLTAFNSIKIISDLGKGSK